MPIQETKAVRDVLDKLQHELGNIEPGRVTLDRVMPKMDEVGRKIGEVHGIGEHPVNLMFVAARRPDDVMVALNVRTVDRLVLSFRDPSGKLSILPFKLDYGGEGYLDNRARVNDADMWRRIRIQEKIGGLREAAIAVEVPDYDQLRVRGLIFDEGVLAAAFSDSGHLSGYNAVEKSGRIRIEDFRRVEAAPPKFFEALAGEGEFSDELAAIIGRMGDAFSYIGNNLLGDGIKEQLRRGKVETQVAVSHSPVTIRQEGMSYMYTFGGLRTAIGMSGVDWQGINEGHLPYLFVPHPQELPDYERGRLIVKVPTSGASVRIETMDAGRNWQNSGADPGIIRKPEVLSGLIRAVDYRLPEAQLAGTKIGERPVIPGVADFSDVPKPETPQARLKRCQADVDVATAKVQGIRAQLDSLTAQQSGNFDSGYYYSYGTYHDSEYRQRSMIERSLSEAQTALRSAQQRLEQEQSLQVPGGNQTRSPKPWKKASGGGYGQKRNKG